jgi:urease subunit beta
VTTPRPSEHGAAPFVPGEVRLAEVAVPQPEPVLSISVTNRGDRPVQVGSHYHFAEANPALAFDRQLAWGLRLCIPAGTAVRFEPNVKRVVGLVPLAGSRFVPGLRGEVAGSLDRDDRTV